LIPEGKTIKFTPEEFDIVLCGNSFIDLKEWRSSTEY